MNERRFQYGCQIHGMHWLCRDNGNIVCLAPGCQFKIVARRDTDKQIRTLLDRKEEK